MLGTEDVPVHPGPVQSASHPHVEVLELAAAPAGTYSDPPQFGASQRSLLEFEKPGGHAQELPLSVP